MMDKIYLAEEDMRGNKERDEHAGNTFADEQAGLLAKGQERYRGFESEPVQYAAVE